MITSTKNPRIVDARKLTLRKHRHKQDRFLVEGLQLLAIAAEVLSTPGGTERVKPLDVFFSRPLFTGDTAPRLLDELIRAGATPLEVAPHVLDTLSERDTSQGLAATFALSALEYTVETLTNEHLTMNKQGSGEQGAGSNAAETGVAPSQQKAQLEPRNSTLVLILDRLQDPGNLGTLIRAADAVGVQAVVLLEPCVDPFDPKTVRGTMGSLFTVPFSRVKTPHEILPRLAALGYHPVGADAGLGQTVWAGDSLRGPVALILGNEARGLSEDLQPYLTDYVSLPLHGRAESLNVSIAGGVLMYEWLRVNQKTTLKTP